ncbi:MAG: thioredoxin-disulfide reductase [Candidatus Buchananbacteria bacterium]
MPESKYDAVIIGAGPAGLTAGIYCARRQLSTLIIAKSLGGQAALASEVENWPGIKSISGFELMNNFKEQTDKLGVKYNFNEVNKIEKTDDGFIIKTNKDEIEAKAVILSFGLTPRDLGVPGEEKLKGRGVTYCAICDGPLYKGKTVAVVGGGNSALEAAQYLSKIAEKVYLLNQSDKFNVEPYLMDEINSIENLESYCFTKITEIKGENKVESIIIEDARDGVEAREIFVNGVFIEIGHQPKTGWLKDFIDLNEKGEIIIDGSNKTTVEGIFAAGDCTNTEYKQIIIAAGEGAKAALQAYKYIVAKEGRSLRPDWGKCKTVEKEEVGKKLNK